MESLPVEELLSLWQLYKIPFEDTTKFLNNAQQTDKPKMKTSSHNAKYQINSHKLKYIGTSTFYQLSIKCCRGTFTELHINICLQININKAVYQSRESKTVSQTVSDFPIKRKYEKLFYKKAKCQNVFFINIFWVFPCFFLISLVKKKTSKWNYSIILCLISF